MTGFGPRAGGLRLIRIVLVCVAIGVVLNTTGGVLLYLANQERAQQINEERLRNTTAGCLLASAQNRAILSFLERRKADRGTLRDARPLFPVRTARECRALSRRQVTK